MTIDTFLDDLLNELQNRKFGTAGVDLFTGGLYDTEENCISVTPYTGTNPDYIKSGEENFHNPYISVLVRNIDLKTAYQNAFAVYKLWKSLYNTQIGSTKFIHIKARGTPGFIGFSENNAAIYSVNFSLMF